MDPDVAAAIPDLVGRGALAPGQAAPLLRAARGERVSVRAELRALLYLGVLLVMGGVSLLVKQNLARIGPLTIAAAIGLAALGCFAWVARRAAPFTWGPSWSKAEEPHLGLDYLLLLGVLLAAADLAYLEARFTPLGAHWPYHLLIVALLAGAAAVRWDSRLVFALALSTFAAWRGVAVGVAAAPAWLKWPGGGEAALRWNAIACGLAFVALGWALARGRRKAHFEPVAAHLGWLLVLAGLATGMAGGLGRSWVAWALLLLGVGAALAVWSFRRRRFWLFALGLAGAYAGHARPAAELVDAGSLGCLWFFWTSGAVVALLVWAHFHLRRTS
jgi:hypothetical protein